MAQAVSSVNASGVFGLFGDGSAWVGRPSSLREQPGNAMSSGWRVNSVAGAPGAGDVSHQQG